MNKIAAVFTQTGGGCQHLSHRQFQNWIFYSTTYQELSFIPYVVHKSFKQKEQKQLSKIWHIHASLAGSKLPEQSTSTTVHKCWCFGKCCSTYTRTMIQIASSYMNRQRYWASRFTVIKYFPPPIKLNYDWLIQSTKWFPNLLLLPSPAYRFVY